MGKLQLGVVGVGWIAQVIHLPILRKLPDVEVLAICDKDKRKAKFVAEKFGIRRFYNDLDEMLLAEDLSAIDVCTSTDAHKDVAISALKAGKAVFVEKPLARTLEEAKSIDDAAKKSKAVLMVGMNNRFRPDAIILKSIIEGGGLGKVFAVKAVWLKRDATRNLWLKQKERAGGGVLLDLGIVMIDLALWMLAYPSGMRVSAVNFRHTTKAVEDSSSVFMAAKDGGIITLEVSWSYFVEHETFAFSVFGTEGSASLNPLKVNKDLHGSLVNVAPAKIDSPQVLFRKSYENELRHFVGAAKGLHPVVSTGEEAVHRMRIVDAVYRSASKGREIILA